MSGCAEWDGPCYHSGVAVALSATSTRLRYLSLCTDNGVPPVVPLQGCRRTSVCSGVVRLSLTSPTPCACRTRPRRTRRSLGVCCATD